MHTEVTNQIPESPPLQPALPIAWPKDAKDVRDFFHADFISAKFAAADQTPCNEDQYLISAHDFLSAVNWWANFPHVPRVDQAAPLPLLIRDIVRDLGITALDACRALKDIGNYSVNMAVTAEMAAKLRELFPVPQAAPAAVAVPDGWKLVPVDPTEQMEQAAADYLGECVKAWGLWKAMISSAPECAALAATPAAWAKPVSELLGHISDVLPDNAFDKIDTKKWNAVSALVGAATPAAAAPVVTTIPDAAYCALQYVEHALAAIANREELVEGTIERVDTIGKASKRAKAALTRLQAVAHHFNALEESPAAAAPLLDFLPFSARSAIAARHGMKVTVEFNALVREVIAEYLARAVPSDFAAAAPVVLPEPDAVINEVMELVEKASVQRASMAVLIYTEQPKELSDKAAVQERDTVKLIEAKLRALLAGVSAPAAHAVPVKPQPITLTVNQLRQAIEFGTGGFTPDTTDELETQLSICWGSLKDDDGTVTECMRCWLFDYPEEGAIPLDEQPTERDLASLATPQAQADARDAKRYRWCREQAEFYPMVLDGTGLLCADLAEAESGIDAAIAAQAAQGGE